MAISQPTYPVTTSNLVTHIGTYADSLVTTMATDSELSSAKATTAGVAVHNGTSYPSRPSGHGSVLWIGPTDPGASAQNGDAWIDTA